MRIPCPYCGERDGAEFTYRGDASPVRPAADALEAAFVEYVYMRSNPAGEISEHWYHGQGCRNWLVVKRNTRTHVISAAMLAKTSAP
jgi:heterotetrameric sarcosine oxidase delta subunit